MPSTRSAARHCSIYRAVLRLYPRSFRNDYGEPMAQLFADRVRDVGGKAWLRTIPDLIRTVPVQRTEAAMSLSSGARVVAIALIVLGATVVSVGLGGGAVPGNALILVASIPALLVFWLIFPTVLAVVVWIGVISSGFGDRPLAAAAP